MPQTKKHSGEPVWEVPSRSLVVLFWLLAAGVALWGIWGGSLDTWDEALTGERAREMFRHGLSMTVSTLGKPDFNKPPLYYWVAAMGMRLFGLGEFAVRLPSAVMGLGCMIAVYGIARGYGAQRGGALLAVFLLAATPHWLNISREGLLDSGMTLSMLLALWAFAFHPDEFLGPVLAGLALAFGFWIKNPCVLLILPSMLVHARGEERPRRLIVVLAVALLFGCGWYVHQFLVWGERFSGFYFDYNLAQRFTQKFQGHRSALDLYLRYLFRVSPHVLVLAAVAAVAALVGAYRPGRCAKVQGAFVLCWLVLIHLMHSKRDPYLVPVYPFLALAGADMLENCSFRLPNRTLRRGAAACLLVLCVINWAAHYNFRLDRNRGLLDAVAHLDERCREGRILTKGVPLHVASFYLDRVISEYQENDHPGSPSCLVFFAQKGVRTPPADAAPVWDGGQGYSVWRLADSPPR